MIGKFLKQNSIVMYIIHRIYIFYRPTLYVSVKAVSLRSNPTNIASTGLKRPIRCRRHDVILRLKQLIRNRNIQLVNKTKCARNHLVKPQPEPVCSQLNTALFS